MAQTQVKKLMFYNSSTDQRKPLKDSDQNSQKRD